MRHIAVVFLAIGCLLLPAFGMANEPVAKDKAPAADAPIVFKKDKLVIQTKTKKYPFTIEIAETWEEQEHGLMHREKLDKFHGMLFPSKRDRRMMMWMKNTPISLDMFFIDKRGRIIYIFSNTKPNSDEIISAKPPVRAVLEVAGGTAKALGIRTQDRILHPLFKEGGDDDKFPHLKN